MIAGSDQMRSGRRPRCIGIIESNLRLAYPAPERAWFLFSFCLSSMADTHMNTIVMAL